MKQSGSSSRSTIVVLEIAAAARQPTRFKGFEFIRVRSYKKKLKDHPEIERELWRLFSEITFEDQTVKENAGDQQVLAHLDYPKYFDLLGAPLPDGLERILEALSQDRLIRRSASGGWDITCLGAILLSKDLDNFPSLRRKAVRVILYKGKNRIETIREQEGAKGYAAGFEGLITFISALIPSNEVVGAALRKVVPMYPEPAIRELVANALIHQDFSITGTGPMIEIFADRIEITNPGVPLIETQRFLDNPPRSRNEGLASLMRRFGICEERGSGIDKVVFETELYQLPPPVFEVSGHGTRASLFAHRSYAQMEKMDRLQACYLHACLKYVSGDFMTNSSLRERFGIPAKNASMVSRLINEARESNLIRPYDPDAANKKMKYLPFWA